MYQQILTHHQIQYNVNTSEYTTYLTTVTYILEFDGDFADFCDEPVLGLLEVGGTLALLFQKVLQLLDLHACLAPAEEKK